MNNRKLYIELTKYILSGLLLIWYCIMLFNSTKPNVCTEYKMHYIEKELLDWPGYNGLDYSLNKKLMFGSDYKENIAKCKGIGWYETENQATWIGNQAKVYFNITDKIIDNGTMNLELVGFMPEVNVNISINGKNITCFHPTKDIKEYKFFISKDILDDRFLCMTINVDNCKRPCDLGDSKDKRLLGIYVRSINLYKEGDL